MLFRIAGGGVGAFFAVALSLAFVEEMLWDRLIWHRGAEQLHRLPAQTRPSRLALRALLGPWTRTSRAASQPAAFYPSDWCESIDEARRRNG
jgi:hypothetical protein